MMTIVEYLDSKNRYAIDEPISYSFYSTFNVDNGTTISAYNIPSTIIHIKYDNNN